MKKEIHPKYFSESVVTCVCGNTFATGSTSESITIELCSSCHPFYTGKQKLVDTARRVEKFAERTSKKAETVRTKREKLATKKSKKTAV